MRGDVTLSPSTPGAARKYSYAWPAGQQENLTANPRPDTQERPNLGQDGSYYVVSVLGVPPAPSGATVYHGRLCYQLTSNAANNGYVVIPNFASNGQPVGMPFNNAKGPVNFLGLDDFACWSVSAILAFDAYAGVITGDLGIAIGVSTRGILRSQGYGGMEFGPANNGVVTVLTRTADGAAIAFNQATPTQPDITQFNRYEIRLVCPTLASEALAKFYINNVLQFALPWGVGTVLPDQVQGTDLIFTPSLFNYQAVPGTTVRMYLPPWGLTVCAAPDEASLV